ncbi:MAG TPA: DUF456 domain-containing protein [Lysobacter sp.]|nr:DUF456 domain-containing protein [Lysobacter sp.]
MTDLSLVWTVLAVILVIVGIAGTILPALPGIPLVFGGLLLAAWADGFEHVGAWTLGILAVLTLASFAVDLLATALGAKKVGASRLALLGATIGTFAGLFAGFVGIFVGPFVGAVLGELLHRRRLRTEDMGHATRVGVGTWMGLLLGTVLKLAIAFAMLGYFAIVWVANRGG